MTAKDIAEMENEIINANTKEDFKKFLDNNEENFPDFTLAEYLNFLLADKNLEKAEVIKNSQIGTYAYKIFFRRKKKQFPSKNFSPCLCNETFSTRDKQAFILRQCQKTLREGRLGRRDNFCIESRIRP